MRLVSQWRGIVVPLSRHYAVLNNQSARCASTLTRFTPLLGQQTSASQQCRTAYNPFNHYGESEDIPHDHETDEADKPKGKQKRQDKRRKLQQSGHSTHNHYDDLDGDAVTDSVLFHDFRIVGWSPDEIYSVVMNVAEYKEFIPYCIKSPVVSQHSTKRHDYMEAELEVGFKYYQLSYTSKVDGSTTLDGKKIVTAVCENKKLFDHLNMEWVIAPGPKEHTSTMDFNVSFAFSNVVYNTVASMFKSSVVDQMIPAFESRLREVYGEPTILSSLSAAAGKVHRRKKRR